MAKRFYDNTIPTDKVEISVKHDSIKLEFITRGASVLFLDSKEAEALALYLLDSIKKCDVE